MVEDALLRRHYSSETIQSSSRHDWRTLVIPRESNSICFILKKIAIAIAGPIK